jgi:4-hydroxy-2-oxoglutarate aldolase
VTRPLEGVLGPVVSTFDDNGDIAPDAFVANLQAHLAAGLAGIVVAGSTGEAALLDEDERARLVELARPVVSADRWLVAGIGGESTRITLTRARACAERGADALLMVSPHYYTAAMTMPALRAHFTRVADASSVPIILYNIPKYTHFSLTPELVADLAEHGNIVGIKDSSGDLELLRGYLAARSPRFTVLTGNGPTLAQAIALGARGGILGVALFRGVESVEIHALASGGDHGAAETAQAALTPAAREIVGGLGVPGVKAAMDMVGLYGGPVRSPLMPLGDSDRARVADLLGARRPSPVG